MNKALRDKKSGQALVEVMIAVGVLTVGFLGIVSLLSRALALNRVVADNYTGTYLAAEGIEVTKNIIDGNVVQGRAWNQGITDGSYEVDQSSLILSGYTDRPLLFSPTTNLYDYSGNVQTTFRRRIIISLVSQNEIQVNSIVSWVARGGGTSEVTLEDHFFNWR